MKRGRVYLPCWCMMVIYSVCFSENLNIEISVLKCCESSASLNIKLLNSLRLYKSYIFSVHVLKELFLYLTTLVYFIVQPEECPKNLCIDSTKLLIQKNNSGHIRNKTLYLIYIVILVF